MKRKFGTRRNVYMEETPGAGGGGAAPAPAPPAPAPAPAPAGAPAPAPAPAEPSGSPSALSGGSEWTPQSIPEKFVVKSADGEMDVQATMRKVDEHRASLEKRLGQGGVRPKTPDEYKVPDTEAFKTLQLDDAATAAFRKEAHDMGLSQEQYAGVMSKWATLAPQLVMAGQEQTTEAAVGALREAWGGDYDAKIKDSFGVVNRMAVAAGIPFAEVEKAIGNNPVAIRLFAALAPEMGEDKTPAAAAGATGGGETSAGYMQQNWAAYSDPKHAQHKAVTDRVAALSARENKGSAAL